MKKILIFVCFIISFTSCKQKEKKETTVENEKPAIKIDSLLITDTSWGFINSKLNFSDLKVIYGEDNVKDERICSPECIDTIDVTKIYPGTSKEIIVYWKDSAYHKTIGMLLCYADSAAYHTSAGLKIGSSLKDILQLNGKKINFAGFGWDYGGYLHSYNNGTMEKSPISFRLDLMDDSGTELLGDLELNTDMPAVQKKLDKIKVYQISLSFHKEDL
jgi:hypothetical protein